jgi:pimeloyl-ACP methyl ester carboxylesterase
MEKASMYGTKRTLHILWNASLLCAVVLAGCARLPASTIENYGNRQIEYALLDTAPPVVVFENGLGAKMSSWDKVFASIGEQATVFAYNRPGYGSSDPAPTPRDGAHIVAELRSLLQSKGLPPPYVLVGHSLGGLYMQLFARQYPDEVAGMVLVDATHPTQFHGKGSMENWPVAVRILKLFLSDSQENELALSPETGNQVLKEPSFAGKPVVILSVKDAATSDTARFYQDKRADLARLYPGSRLEWVDSGHFIQQDRPEIVIQAIQDILAGYHP